MRRRSLKSPIFVNALVSAKPSEVARRFGDVGRGRCFSHTFRARHLGHSARHQKRTIPAPAVLSRFAEFARTDAIGAFFVLLNLLKCKAECVS